MINHAQDPSGIQGPCGIQGPSGIRGHTGTQSFKVCLIGDGNVGKTAFIRKLKVYLSWPAQSQIFQTSYDSTTGVEVHQLKFETNYGLIALNVWDCAGQERYSGLRHGYWLASQGVIGMFDLSRSETYQGLKKWLEQFHRQESTCPMVICGNKKDISTIKFEDLTLHQELSQKWNCEIGSCNISAKNDQDITCPLELLMCEMTNRPDLFILSPKAGPADQNE